MSDANVSDNNPTDAPAPEVVSAQVPPLSLEAQLEIGKAKLAAALAAERTGTVVNTPESEKPAPAAEVDKALEVPEQFKDKDGNLDVEKLNKSKQHLELSLEEKRKSIEEYKAKQREFTQVSVEVAKVKDAAPLSDVDLEKEVEANLEKNPANAVIDAARKIVQKELASRERARAQEQQQEQWLVKLDSYGVENPWIYSEAGKAAINEVLGKDPELFKTSDPYGYALAKVDKTKFQAGQTAGNPNATPTASAPRTPILSGNRAVPPPVSQAGSNEAKLKELSQAMMAASSDKERLALAKQMDDLVAKQIGVKPPPRF
jgi:hypothetical protein